MCRRANIHFISFSSSCFHSVSSSILFEDICIYTLSSLNFLCIWSLLHVFYRKADRKFWVLMPNGLQPIWARHSATVVLFMTFRLNVLLSFSSLWTVGVTYIFYIHVLQMMNHRDFWFPKHNTAWSGTIGTKFLKTVHQTVWVSTQRGRGDSCHFPPGSSGSNRKKNLILKVHKSSAVKWSIKSAAVNLTQFVNKWLLGPGAPQLFSRCYVVKLMN